ncbi:hypothetical protein BJV78DRAFT_1262014 [Lactifluus subvellereus]|nr:hypothetical protein BJV78DRAFT_1262014 [Lactifluus subvellereus]
MRPKARHNTRSSALLNVLLFFPFPLSPPTATPLTSSITTVVALAFSLAVLITHVSLHHDTTAG